MVLVQTQQQQTSSQLTDYFKFAVYWRGIQSLDWQRLETSGPVTSANFSLGARDKAPFLVKVAGVNWRNVEGASSEATEALQLIDRPLRMRLISIKSCVLDPDDSARRVRLTWQLNWVAFPGLLTDDLLHFKLNYTGVSQFETTDGELLKRLQREREQISFPSQQSSMNFEHTLTGLLPNTLYRVSVRAMFKKLPPTLPLQVAEIDCPKTSSGVPLFVPAPQPVNQTERSVSLKLRKPEADYGEPSFYQILYALPAESDKIYVYSDFSKHELWPSSNQASLFQLDKAKLIAGRRRVKRSLSNQSSNHIAFSLQACVEENRCSHSDWLLPVAWNLLDTATSTVRPGPVQDDPLWPAVQYYRANAGPRIQGDDSESPWTFPKDVAAPADGSRDEGHVGTAIFSFPLIWTILSILGIMLLIFGVAAMLLLCSRRQKVVKPHKPVSDKPMMLPAQHCYSMEPVTPVPSSIENTMRYSSFTPAANSCFSVETLPLLSNVGGQESSELFTNVQRALSLRTSGNRFSTSVIPADALAEHVNMLKLNNCSLMANEFDSIDPGGQYSWECSNRPNNRPKNRYANVVAYDHSRVILKHVQSIDSKGIRRIEADSDYINANYVDGYRQKRAYIATQGPVSNTMCDFWRMVWENNTSLIVAMTRLEEKVRSKCECYWPMEEGETPHVYEEMEVSLVDCLELAYYTLRTLVVKNLATQEERQVKHFQYTAWPDHGSPRHPAPILMFIERINQTRAELESTAPTVVHCSAGVGRTGALIAIDMLLAQLTQEAAVNVKQVVSQLRSQRNFMVQTQDQYEFIYEAVLEAAIALPNSQLFIEQFPMRLNQLCQVLRNNQDGKLYTGLVIEFRRLQSQAMLNDSTINCDQMIQRGLLCPLDPDSASRVGSLFDQADEPRLVATLPCNMAKNQSLEIVPYNSNRVCLQGAADYINASYIDGYLTRVAYIATQTPLDSTVGDFWRMIWESKSCIIVKLNSIINSEYAMETTKPYWPRRTAVHYENLTVEPIAEFSMTSFILREFRLTDRSNGVWRTIRQFDVSESLMHLATYTPVDFEVETRGGQHSVLLSEPQHKEAAAALLECIGQAHTTKNQFGIDGPITVHCDVGAGRTGIFLAVSLLIQRIRMEGVVDIYQTVKMLRWQRRGLVESVQDYAFCHAAILEYLHSLEHNI
ncbi:hypothetical protein Ciccas_007905 [Cichlidogyrus casuarinus]|uniref:Protein-tyrosine-phosphatase n=1 Tax=Cichlidogyrus casuarinus TaxID=1844966 RepID=A0ABD2Q1S4_9PLAT